MALVSNLCLYMVNTTNGSLFHEILSFLTLQILGGEAGEGVGEED